MSLCTRGETKNRIRSAGPSSPIAVFLPGMKIETAQLTLQAQFANTAACQRRIREGDLLLIGIYHGPEGVVRFQEDLIELGIDKKRYDFA